MGWNSDEVTIDLTPGDLSGVVLSGIGEQLEPVAVPPNGLIIAPGAAVVAGVTVSDDGARTVDGLEPGVALRVYIDAANVVHVEHGMGTFPADSVPICYRAEDGEIIDCRIIGSVRGGGA